MKMLVIKGIGCQKREKIGLKSQKLFINAHYFGQTNLKAVILVLYKWIFLYFFSSFFFTD